MSVIVENTPAAWSARADAPTSWQAAGWSEAGQTQRFVAVLRHLDLRAGETLLDFGCGTGRFSEFVPREVAYYGFDTATGMIDRARTDHPNGTFSGTIPQTIFDHVVAVGPFNLPGQDAFEKVDELWHMSTRRSLVVSLYRGHDERCVRFEPVSVTGWARRLGARRFVVAADHLDNDVILAVYK